MSAYAEIFCLSKRDLPVFSGLQVQPATWIWIPFSPINKEIVASAYERGREGGGARRALCCAKAFPKRTDHRLGPAIDFPPSISPSNLQEQKWRSDAHYSLSLGHRHTQRSRRPYTHVGARADPVWQFLSASIVPVTQCALWMVSKHSCRVVLHQRRDNSPSS